MPAQNLTDPHTLIIFTTAPAGLGHLRVTQALWDGLPSGCHSFVLGLHDKAISSIHRVLSNNRFLVNTQTFVQHNHVAESVFTKLYRDNLRRDSKEVYDQLYTLITSHQPKLNNVYIVATHFGLAHQIAEIKHDLIGNTGINISLHVVVTDDTFQPIWAIEGVDRLCVPSEHTKVRYHNYFEANHFNPTHIDVIPYPITPKLAHSNITILKNRRQQFLVKSNKPIRLLVPISGAATQLDYLLLLLHLLTKQKSIQFQPTIVAAYNRVTASFTNIVKHLPNTQTLLGMTNQETIEKYTTTLLDPEPIALEITKPSEQTYKALFTPKQAGGVILLFTPPIGKQEEDNLDFLKSHGLLPNQKQTEQLAQLPKLNSKELESLCSEAVNWRAIILPPHPRDSANMIINLKNFGILTSMLAYKVKKVPELTDTGVRQFWDSIAE